MITETLTPIQIVNKIGSSLVHSGGLVLEVYDELSINTEIFDKADWSQMIREVAEAGREDWLDIIDNGFSQNNFSFVTKVSPDGKNRWYFEVGLTVEGEKANECQQRLQCCNAETGELDISATLDYWFNIGYEPFYSIDRARSHLSRIDWLNEPWAEPIKNKVSLWEKGIWVNRDGTPNYRKTINYWLSVNDLLAWQKHFFSMDDEWCLPIQEEIMLRRMSQPSKASEIA